MSSNNPVECSRAEKDPVLLHLELHFDWYSSKIFISQNQKTLRFLSPEGEHLSLDAEAARTFLKTLVCCTDRLTGLLCLEAEAAFDDLSLWERGSLIAEDHFEQYVLEREEQYPYEDGARESAENRFQEKAYEVWNECVSGFYGRSTGLGRA